MVGLLFIFRDSIKLKERKDVSMSDLELVYLEIEPLKSCPFIIIAWYRPTSSSVDLFAKLERVLSFLNNEEPKRVTMNTSTIIDHVAITHPQNVHKISSSDQYMAYCVRKFNSAI